MIQFFERFGLLINDKIVKTPIAIASMAGITDAAYALERAEHIGVAFLGGYNIDIPAIEAARTVVAGGREEFLAEDPVAELKEQVSKMSASRVVPGLNLRGCSPGAFREVADAIGDAPVYEIDAHCRQKPMIDAGCGEYYLNNPRELGDIIRALKTSDVTVSVKIRAGVSADDARLCRSLVDAGADILHVDLMDFGVRRLREIRNSCSAQIIANNGISSFDKMRDVLSHGADLVSLARNSDERTLSGLDAAISRYADESGWYNSPKQLCRGGDLRALCFCCMPVKSCPLLPTLDRLAISPETYIALKQRLVSGTPLESGAQTCFGSLAYCCKASAPCMFREMTLSQAGLSSKEYMKCKRQLADGIMAEVFSGRVTGEAE